MKHISAPGQWRAHIEILLWRHGWVAPWAAVAVLAAAALQIWVLEPTRNAWVSASTQLIQLTLDRSRPRDSVPAGEPQQLAQLRSTLGSTADATALIRRMGELAQAENIQLVQAEYHQQVDPVTSLLQVQVSQPVKASYPQVRRYIESVLRTLPNVSLDQIAARRENVGQAQLEVRLRWSIWLHGSSAPPAASTAQKAVP